MAGRGLFHRPPQPQQRIRRVPLREPQTVQVTADDTVGLSESVARTLTLARTLGAGAFDPKIFDPAVFDCAEPVAISESVAAQKVGGLVSRTADDTVTISESVSRTGTFLRAVSDSVTASESVARAVSLLRTASDSVGLSDAVARTLTLLRRVGVGSFDPAVFSSDFDIEGDRVTLSESVAGLKVIARTVADTVTLSDSVARIVTNLRTAADSVTASDTVARVVGLFRSNADSVTISESVDALKIGGGIKSATAADSVSLTESVSRVVTLIRTAADAVGISESVAQLITTVATMADSVSLSDAVSRATAARRQVSDTVTVSDTVDVIKNGVPLSGLGHHVVGDVRRRRALGGLDTDRRRRLFQQIIEDTEPLTLDDEDAIAALLLAEDD